MCILKCNSSAAYKHKTPIIKMCIYEEFMSLMACWKKESSLKVSRFLKQPSQRDNSKAQTFKGVPRNSISRRSEVPSMTRKALEVVYKPALSSETWPFPPSHLKAGERRAELKDDDSCREKIHFQCRYPAFHAI